MASPSVTYSFSPATTIASSQVNANFTDIINALTDATKSLSIDALTCAGTVLFKGNVTVGDATTDTISYVSRVASSISPSVTNTYDLGGSSLVWANVYATSFRGTIATAAQGNITSLGTLTSLAVTGNVTVDTDTFFVDATNNAVGIGTTTLVGKLHLHAAASLPTLTGPNIAATVDTDAYPVFSTLFYGHDNVGMLWDAYYTTNYISSDPGSNFRLTKASDVLGFWASSGNTAGNTITWTSSLFISAGGSVGVKNTGFLGDLDVKSTLVVSDTTAATGQKLVFVTQNTSQNYFIGVNDAGYLSIGTAGNGATVGSLVSGIYVNSNNYLGLGTSSLGGRLTAKTDGTTAVAVVNAANTTVAQLGESSSHGDFILRDSAGDIAHRINSTAIIFNEKGADIDFRIESDTVEYAFFVDGSTGYIGINEATPDSQLHMSNASGPCALAIDSAAANGSSIVFNKAGAPGWLLGTVNADNAIGFYYSGSYRLYIDSSGNVGIGTSGPGSTLDTVGIIKSRSDNSNFSVYLADNNYRGTLQANTDGIDLKATYNINGFITFTTVTGGSAYERMRINNSGNVGIGTSPSYKLDTIGTGAGGTVIARIGNSDRGLGLYIGQTSTASFLQTALIADYGTEYDLLLQPNGGNVGIGTTPIGAYRLSLDSVEGDSGIYVQAGSSSSNASLYISNHNGATEYFYVRGDGEIFMKSISGGAGSGTYNLRWTSGTGQITYDTSSARYKDNIRDSSYGLDIVRSLQPRQFKYKDTGREDVGFIAEEVVDLIPELVPLDSQGRPDAVNYDRITSVLVKAIQEQQALIETLKQRLDALEGASI